MDGNGSLFATLQGNQRDIILKFSVDLPKKHGRGGQSAPRFGRLRLEKRQNQVRKVCETINQIFITDNKLNISGLIIAGSADFKHEIPESEVLDYRVKNIVLKIVDVGQGGENGLNQAISLASDTLQGVKFCHEKNLLKK